MRTIHNPTSQEKHKCKVTIFKTKIYLQKSLSTWEFSDRYSVICPPPSPFLTPGPDLDFWPSFQTHSCAPCPASLPLSVLRWPRLRVQVVETELNILVTYSRFLWTQEAAEFQNYKWLSLMGLVVVEFYEWKCTWVCLQCSYIALLMGKKKKKSSLDMLISCVYTFICYRRDKYVTRKYNKYRRSRRWGGGERVLRKKALAELRYWWRLTIYSLQNVRQPLN